jgi:hypothetical protein
VSLTPIDMVPKIIPRRDEGHSSPMGDRDNYLSNWKKYSIIIISAAKSRLQNVVNILIRNLCLGLEVDRNSVSAPKVGKLPLSA